MLRRFKKAVEKEGLRRMAGRLAHGGRGSFGSLLLLAGAPGWMDEGSLSEVQL